MNLTNLETKSWEKYWLKISHFIYTAFHITFSYTWDARKYKNTLKQQGVQN